MTPLPAVAGAVRVEILWTQEGIPCANILHLGYTGDPPDAGELAVLANAVFENFWSLDFAAIFSTGTTLVGIRCTDLSSDTGAVGEYTSGVTGTDATGFQPAQASMLVNFAISRRYRGGHPRMYLPGLGRSALDTASTWTSDAVSRASVAISAYISGIATVSFGANTVTGPIAISYRNANAPRVDPLVELITGGVVSGLLATQRRRIRASSY